MKHNHYDNNEFFNQYSKMARSRYGLEAAGEWPQVKQLLPQLEGKDILDLGCGYGWHCKYFSNLKARSILGIDLSEKMINKAKKINMEENIEYRVSSIEDLETTDSYDLVFSSLTLHYIEDYPGLLTKVKSLLNPKGTFLFSVEHPVFTAQGSQEWVMGPNNIPSHWPVDSYYDESWRQSNFLDTKVEKFHRTLTSYINPLIKLGFTLEAVTEVIPPQEWVELDPRNADELRRPMMLIIKARL